MRRKSPPRIWDVHCHIVGVPGPSPEEAMTQLLRRADRMGIERLIICMGSTFIHDPTPEQLRLQNDQALRALDRGGDRALGLAYVSPNHVETSRKEIDRCVRDGPMVGIKLWVARRCSDPAVDPIVARVTELKGIVLQHSWTKTTGNLPGESTAEDVAAMAARHPKASFVCGHAGGQWELGIRAVRASPNVRVDVAGADPTAGLVEAAVRELGASRVVYGSDAGGRSFASQLAKVFSAPLSDEDRARVLGGNVREMLAPILRAKGVPFEP